MEEGQEVLLLPGAAEERGWRPVTWVALVQELKKVSYMAAPMVVVSVAQYLLQVVSLIMAGHLGELSLSSVSIATSFANVTGFSLMFGLAEALETLCGQAYGAGQYQKYGTYTYCAIISIIPICVPVSILWIFMDKLLISMGQDPEISLMACKYAVCLIPALYGFAILQAFFRYFQCQSLIQPILISACAALCFHIPLCWALVYKCGLGNRGGALAIGLSYWLNVIILAVYMRFSSSCEKTRVFYLKDFFSSTKEFFRFGVPSAIMVCIEWWTFEILILLAGLLPDSQLETSVLSICLTTITLHYFLQYGIGSAASTRVSNELGAGNPQAARAVVRVIIVISLTEAVVVSATLFSCRYVFGYAFSNEKGVVDYVAEVAPLLCLSVIMDSLQTVLSGIARGCGLQHIGAFINLCAYYIAGISVAALLCFVLNLRGKGLWIGILTGTTVQAALLALITASTNWQQQAVKARERMLEGAIPGNGELA